MHKSININGRVLQNTMNEWRKRFPERSCDEESLVHKALASFTTYLKQERKQVTRLERIVAADQLKANLPKPEQTNTPKNTRPWRGK